MSLATQSFESQRPQHFRTRLDQYPFNSRSNMHVNLVYCILNLRAQDLTRKNPAYRRQSIFRPMRIVAQIQKDPTSKAKFVKNNTFFFCSAMLHLLWEKKYSNLRPLLSISFPQGFRKFNKLGHWTWGSGRKRRLNEVNKGKKSIIFFLPLQF